MYGRRKAIIGSLVAIIAIVIGITSYIQGKHYVTRNEVKDYLLEEKGIAETDIVELDSFIANLSGDRNWLIFVELKGDKGHYYYYYDRDKNKVFLESYILDGIEYSDPSEAPNK